MERTFLLIEEKNILKQVIASRLKELRLSKGLSVEDIEAIIDDPNYPKYERGQKLISTMWIKKAADFYEVSTDYLYGRTDNTEIAKTPPQSL